MALRLVARIAAKRKTSPIPLTGETEREGGGVASKEEIRAAADSMEQFMFAPHELPLDAELDERYLECARHALEAAEYQRFLQRSDQR